MSIDGVAPDTAGVIWTVTPTRITMYKRASDCISEMWIKSEKDGIYGEYLWSSCGTEKIWDKVTMRWTLDGDVLTITLNGDGPTLVMHRTSYEQEAGAGSGK